MASMSSTDHGVSCPKCGEVLFTPEWSEYVSERLIVNLWACTECGDRFDTSACLGADAETADISVLMKEFVQLQLAA